MPPPEVQIYILTLHLPITILIKNIILNFQSSNSLVLLFQLLFFAYHNMTVLSIENVYVFHYAIFIYFFLLRTKVKYKTPKVNLFL